ncbi:hypothetical protein [Halarsenatibacter silvermanii]|uniref:Uncharacterized protein n=1 Tax=Halarsenatibacter silvermanii TaxID=321763 RepID=A0A1G9M230_9FIRM|nr:hypothetical protein [Halarsenatibacter silvermanii]SDL68319.1 hypothetical protein SAMN04488692_10783 [Halarsenatibacter silvermanii]
MKLIKYAIAVIFFVLAVLFGLIFPNFDLSYPVTNIIMRRSALTHSIILPLIWYHLIGKSKPVSRFICMGLFLGITVFLAFMARPVLLEGGTLIFFPWLGRFEFMPSEVARVVGLGVSGLWILGNIYWGMEYYLKAAGSKTWINVFSYLAIVVTVFGYAEYAGRAWLLPAVILGAIFVLVYR